MTTDDNNNNDSIFEGGVFDDSSNNKDDEEEVDGNEALAQVIEDAPVLNLLLRAHGSSNEVIIEAACKMFRKFMEGSIGTSFEQAEEGKTPYQAIAFKLPIFLIKSDKFKENEGEDKSL